MQPHYTDVNDTIGKVGNDTIRPPTIRGLRKVSQLIHA